MDTQRKVDLSLKDQNSEDRKIIVATANPAPDAGFAITKEGLAMNRNGIIDLRSDTVTQPTDEMLHAMLAAQIGDDVYEDDPTTNRLEMLAAETLGKEAALFVPSGTMGNQIGILVGTSRGDEVICGRKSHVFEHEVGACSVLSGVTLHTLDYPDSVPDLEMIRHAIRTTDIHEPPTRLLCLENALANGKVVPVELLGEIYAFAKKTGLTIHLDGARVFNAAVSLGNDVREITQYCDTVNACLSKGLSAPIGSILAGSSETIRRARKYRKMLGGGMRQTGILAAAGIVAIETMTQRLAEDHRTADLLAAELSKINNVNVKNDRRDINMVFFDIDFNCDEGSAQLLREALPKKFKKNGIYICGYIEADKEWRWVTHNDISDDDVHTAVNMLRELLDALR